MDTFSPQGLEPQKPFAIRQETLGQICTSSLCGDSVKNIGSFHAENKPASPYANTMRFLKTARSWVGGASPVPFPARGFSPDPQQTTTSARGPGVPLKLSAALYEHLVLGG
jgi:hypothetical protein